MPQTFLSNGGLAFIAHELNTPLILMKHYADLMKDSRGEQKQKITEAMILLSSELLQSSEFMLQGLSIKKSACRFRSTPLNLKTTIEERLELFTPLIKQKHIIFYNEIHPKLHSLVPKDSLVIVLNNLIGNALKFTPQHGTITLKNHSRIIQIHDSAPAILPHDRLKIFEAFQKAASTESHSGFGLGLHICSEVIKEWGGKIWLRSSSQGNQFSFTIPNA